MNYRTNLCGCLLILVAASFVCNYFAIDSLLYTFNPLHGSPPALRYWYAPGAWVGFAAGFQLLAAACFVKLVQDRGESEI